MTNSTASPSRAAGVVCIGGGKLTRTRHEESPMNRKAATAITAIVLAIMGYIVVGSMARVRKQGEGCVEFNGGKYCAKAAGGDDKEAKPGAHTAACGKPP